MAKKRDPLVNIYRYSKVEFTFTGKRKRHFSTYSKGSSNNNDNNKHNTRIIFNIILTISLIISLYIFYISHTVDILNSYLSFVGSFLFVSSLVLLYSSVYAIHDLYVNIDSYINVYINLRK